MKEIVPGNGIPKPKKFYCEFSDCNFEGDFAKVAAHELSCKFRDDNIKILQKWSDFCRHHQPN